MISEFCLSFDIHDEGIFLLLIRFSKFFHRMLAFDLLVHIYNSNYQKIRYILKKSKFFYKQFCIFFVLFLECPAPQDLSNEHL